MFGGSLRRLCVHGMYHGVHRRNTSFLDSFLVNSITGNLTEVSSHELQAEQQVGTANTAAVDSTSNYVYNTVTGFTFVNGILAPVSTIPTPTGATVEGVLASPDTPFLFVQISTTGLSSDLVNADGSLTPAATSVSGGALVVTGAIPVPNQPYLQVNPTADINFSVVVGKVQTIPININNWGFGPLTIDSITIAGDPSLTISNTCTTPIPPSGTCIPVVTYAPTIAGPASAVVTIVSNSPIAATQTVTIGASSIEPFSDPVLIPSQQILIPDTAQGSSSTLAIQLQNATNASAPLTVSGITWTGTNPNDFSQTNNCTGQIAVGASCTINIIFTPQALGNRAAILNIANNSPDGPVAAMVNGNGVTTVTKWTFNASAVGPGTITQTPAGTSFPNNTTLYLTAAPNANSSFVNWSTGCPMNEGLVPCTVVLTQNTTITAQFEANVTLTTSVVGPGIITQAPAGTSFRPGDSVVLTAVPNTGAQFSGWTPAGVCILGNAPPTQCFITLNANTAVTATFTGGPQVTLATNVSGARDDYAVARRHQLRFWNFDHADCRARRRRDIRQLVGRVRGQHQSGVHVYNFGEHHGERDVHPAVHAFDQRFGPRHDSTIAYRYRVQFRNINYVDRRPQFWSHVHQLGGRLRRQHHRGLHLRHLRQHGGHRHVHRESGGHRAAAHANGHARHGFHLSAQHRGIRQPTDSDRRMFDSRRQLHRQRHHLDRNHYRAQRERSPRGSSRIIFGREWSARLKSSPDVNAGSVASSIDRRAPDVLAGGIALAADAARRANEFRACATSAKAFASSAADRGPGPARSMRWRGRRRHASDNRHAGRNL